MAETKPIPVRLENAIIARLDRAATRMGTNRAALMRFLVQTFVETFETSGGVNGLPHNWREVMHNLDGRTFGQQLGSMRQSMSNLRVAETPSDPPTALSVPRKAVTYSKTTKKKKPKP